MRISVCRLSATTLVVDAFLSAALLLCLAVVYLIDSAAPKNRDVSTNKQQSVLVKTEKAPPLRLAVSPEVPQYDNMGRLLERLGPDYQYTNLPLDDLLDSERVAQFQVIFLTCSGYTDLWLSERTGGTRRGSALYRPNGETNERAKQTLRNFVERGGTLYGSDLHYDLIAFCFPEFVDYSGQTPGSPQTLTALVVDEGLREHIGPTISLTFDQGEWRPAAFVGKNVTVYLRGSYDSPLGVQRAAPLLIKFPFGEGNVIFTSFHNEKQNSKAELKLLEYLVFSVLTANIEAEVARTLVQGGFSPAKRNLFSASSQEESVSQTYRNRKIADLQFVLGFQDERATLQLSVIGPDGNHLQKEGTSTLTIDVSQAAIGEWKYSVTALEVPSENFPFTVTIGEK